MGKWNNLILHHSASSYGTARLINKWHRERGWSGIGYHFVILNGRLTQEDFLEQRRCDAMIGQIATGREFDLDQWVEANEVGAHALGFNRDSVGVCMIHRNGPIPVAVLSSTVRLVADLTRRLEIPIDKVLGHGEIDSKKEHCPGTDMDRFRWDVRWMRTAL